MFSQDKELVKKHGPDRAKKIQIRMRELQAALNLGDFARHKTGRARCHELIYGGREYHLSMDLDHPYRLIFTPDYDPDEIPRKEDGGLDWSRVTAIKIMGVEDTHG